MKCKDCTSPGCPYRTTDGEKECAYYGVQTTTYDRVYTAEDLAKMQEALDMWDWEKFRRKTSAMILANLAPSAPYNRSEIVNTALELTDILINRLKTNKEP